MNRSAVREIQGIGRFKFREGELEEFKRLSAQLIEIVRSQDTGTLQYEIYFNDDQSECIVLERYRDSEALVEHAGHLGDWGGQSRDWCPASSLVSRAPTSGRSWLAAGSVSSRRSCLYRKVRR